jgi:ubiquinone/menaquinone biosynthesis C-methylase UbiE
LPSATEGGSVWDLGCYETVAEDLLPAAQAVVAAAALKPGEHVLDIGCGTGNATLLAAKAGADAIGVDPAARLVETARARAAAGGVNAQFMEGEAANVPLRDGWADAVLSVFGVIFAPDASAAATEISRVCAVEARVILSAWLPAGAIADVLKLRGAAIARATGAPPSPPPFSWHDQMALTPLLARYGFTVEVTEREIPFAAASPKAFLDGQFRDHPNWVSIRRVLTDDALRSLRDQALEIATAANEDPGAFRVTSRYVIATARRA